MMTAWPAVEYYIHRSLSFQFNAASCSLPEINLSKVTGMRTRRRATMPELPFLHTRSSLVTHPSDVQHVSLAKEPLTNVMFFMGAFINIRATSIM